MAELSLKSVKSEQDRIALEIEFLSAEANAALPCLVIIDQILNLAGNNAITQKGSTLAVSIRSRAPAVPLVGVTAAPLAEIAELQKDQFIELFSIDDLQNGDRIPDLYAIADGFSALVRAGKKDLAPSRRRTQLLTLLRCPKEDVPFLTSCLPGEFLSKWDAETPHALARWIWHTFVGRPGFLYDELEVATMLGLNPEGLKTLRPKLRACEYTGVFSSPARKRWWGSLINLTVRELTSGSTTEPLWALGRALIGKNREEDYSVCYGSKAKDCVPDVVAYADERQRDRVQTRAGHTKMIETDTPPPGFYQKRVYCGE